jgi:hypothetical protein
MTMLTAKGDGCGGGRRWLRRQKEMVMATEGDGCDGAFSVKLAV